MLDLNCWDQDFIHNYKRYSNGAVLHGVPIIDARPSFPPFQGTKVYLLDTGECVLTIPDLPPSANNASVVPLGFILDEGCAKENGFTIVIGNVGFVRPVSIGGPGVPLKIAKKIAKKPSPNGRRLLF